MFKAACHRRGIISFRGIGERPNTIRKRILRIFLRKYEHDCVRPESCPTTVSRPNLHGWEGSFEGKVLPFVGIVGDVSGHYGTQSFTELTPNGPLNVSVTGHEQEYLVGPRLSVPVGKFTPFGEVMVGAAHIHTGGTLPGPSNTSFATAVGGGLDYRIFRPIALRVEGDYLHTKFFSSTQNNLRLSAGVVFRF